MLRMLIVGYVSAIRSERQLCPEPPVNITNRWFRVLSIKSTILDLSAFSRARHDRFRESDLLRFRNPRTLTMSLTLGSGTCCGW